MLTGLPPSLGATVDRLTASAAAKPATATDQPATTSPVRRLSASETSARAKPAVTHAGGSPGPPGCSSNSDAGRRDAADSPSGVSPASSRNADGLDSSRSDHGNKTRNGVAITIAALSSETGHTQRRAASSTSTRPATITHASGTNAAAIAVSSPVAQAARRAARGEEVSIRAAAWASSGNRMKAVVVPSRPAATAPIATGSKAYAPAIHTRATGAVTRRRVAR